MTTFPLIADDAFLSNCEQCCLVAPNGAIEWLCLPRPDSPSVSARCSTGPRGFPFRPDQRAGSAGSQVCPGHDGARDDLARADRLAGRP